MKQLLLKGILICFAFSINLLGMDVKLNEQKKYEDLPAEVRCLITEFYLQSYMNHWDRIFSFNKIKNYFKKKVDDITLTSSTFTGLNKERLKELIIRLKEQRNNYLIEDLKRTYHDWPLEKLNRELLKLIEHPNASYKNSGILEDAAQLIILGASALDYQNIEGYSLLIHAARAGSKRFTKFFIDNGANLNLKNKSNITALAFAAYYGHLEIAKLLIDKGADSSIKTASNRTALQIAEQKGHTEIVNLLKAHSEASIVSSSSFVQ